MKLEMTYSEALDTYERIFGEEADPLWADGDFEKFHAMLEQAIKTKTPLPDFYEANGIPKDALI